MGSAEVRQAVLANQHCVNAEALLAPWDRPWHYAVRGDGRDSRYDHYTFGRDGLPGGEGEDADVGIPTITAQR